MWCRALLNCGFGSGDDLSIRQVQDARDRNRRAAEGGASISEACTAHERDVEDDIQEHGACCAADAYNSTASGDGNTSGVLDINYAVPQAEVLIAESVLSV